MRLFPKLFLLFVILLFLLLNQPNTVSAITEPERVQSVEVQLSIAGNIYQGLQERMEFSIGRVGDKLLLDQPLGLLTNNKETVRAAITNVFSKVLVGFRIETVDLILDRHTKVVIHLIPLPPLISNIRVDLEIQGLNPELKDFTLGVGSQVEQELNQVFIGLPVAAVSWSEGIFALVVNYLTEREFPGFGSSFQLSAGPQTILKLKLVPQEPTVAAITVDYNSTTILDWLLVRKFRDYEARCLVLKGLPVDFLVRYQPDLEKYLIEHWDGASGSGHSGLTASLGIQAGVKTQANLTLDSQHYRAQLVGRYFIGPDDNFGSFQFDLGYHTVDYEIFTRWYLGEYPGGRFKLGLAIPLEKNFSLGFEYELEEQYKNIWLHFQFERGDYLDLRIGIDQSPNEALIGIHLNDHANLELVDYDSQFGIQLMFNF